VVERRPEKAGVASSILASGTIHFRDINFAQPGSVFSPPSTTLNPQLESSPDFGTILI
jgi:hypothetical protein